MDELEALLELLKSVGIEELLEMCDITPEDVIEILYDGGHIAYPLNLGDR
jgi:hypothetical protein